jgi:hypothetical protein
VTEGREIVEEAVRGVARPGRDSSGKRARKPGHLEWSSSTL